MISDCENFSFEKHFLNEEDQEACNNLPILNSEINDKQHTARNLISIVETREIDQNIRYFSKINQISVYRFTNDDMEVLNKIFNISLSIITICTIIFIIGVLLNTTNILKSYEGTLAFVVLSFYLEIISIYFIFKLFITEINSSEYENLKIIGEIENYLKNNKQDKKILKFDAIRTTELYKRISVFMNVAKEGKYVIS